MIKDEAIEQQAWQGLTDDEIYSLCTYIDHDLLEAAFYKGARAGEQALKEKNCVKGGEQV